MANLYELNKQLEAVWAAIEAATDETGEIPAELDEQLMTLEMAKADKLENICKWRINLISEAKAFRDEEKRIAENRRSKEALIERLERYVGQEVGEGQKLEVGTFKCSWRKSERCEIVDAALIPDDFVEYERKVKLADVKAAFKSEPVPGAKITQHYSLQIK